MGSFVPEPGAAEAAGRSQAELEAGAQAAWMLLGLSLVAAAAGLALGPARVLLLCVALAAAWIGLTRPMILVAGYAAVICSNAADVATTAHHLPPIGGTIVPFLAVVLLARAAVMREHLGGVLKLALPVALYLFGRAYSLQQVTDTEATTTAVIGLAKDLMIVAVFAGFLTRMARVRAVVAAAAIAVGAMAALSVFQYATRSFESTYFGFANAVVRQIVVGQSDGWRLTGPLPDANFYGQLLVLGLPLVATFAVIGERRLTRLAALAGSAAVLAATVFTYSRGALIGLAIVGLVALLALGSRRTILRMALVGVLASLGGAALLPARAFERLAPVWQALHAALTGGQWVMDPALQERLSVVDAALRMFRANPIFGVGTGQFGVEYSQVALRYGFNVGAPAQAHSLYLEILAEGGLVGLALFTGFVGTAMALAIRARRGLAAEGETRDAALVLGILLSTVGYLATSIFLHGAYQRFLWLDVALLLSVWSAAQFRPSSGRESYRTRRRSMISDREYILQAGAVLWRRKLVILAFTLAGLGLGWWQVQTSPRDYQAEETLIYRFGREYFPVTPGEARRDWGENVIVTLDNALFTEMQLLSARDLFTKTADEIWPIAGRKRGANGMPTSTEALASALSRAFRVTRVQGATMVEVSARNPDPAVADRMVKLQVENYLAKRKALFETDATAFFDGRITRALGHLAELTRQREAILARYGQGSGATPGGATGGVMGGGVEALSQVSASADGGAGGSGAAGDAGPGGTAGLAIALQPVDAQISEVNRNLGLLVQERTSADISSAYRREVAPAVEVVDRRPAAGNPIGPSAKLRIAIAGIAAAVIACLLIFLTTALVKFRASLPGAPLNPAHGPAFQSRKGGKSR